MKSNRTYQDLVDNANDIEYAVISVGRRQYVRVVDGVSAWATPKTEWDQVMRMEAERPDDAGEWYTDMCGLLSYDRDFCRKHEDVLGQWHWA